jgi:uncharacterized protein
MNESDVLPMQINEFKRLFHPLSQDWESMQNQESKEKFVETSPVFKSLYNILKSLSGNSFHSQNSLLAKEEGAIFPTGTCFPFDRKLFLTVNGDILPCERINQKFSFGKVTKNEVNINFKEIAERYTLYYKKIWKLCKTCYTKPVCSQCLFYVDNIENKPVCAGYKNKEQYDRFIHSRLSYLSKNPGVYQKMMKETF